MKRAFAVSRCSSRRWLRRRVAGRISARAAACGARKHIPGIDQMGLEELSNWVTVCAPYNGSLEGRAKNPYDPMDCDQVQYRHDSWRQPRTQKPAQGLPGLH